MGCASWLVLSPYLSWLVPVRQNVKQIRRGNEVESGEGQSLCLQVFSQSLLTDRQSGSKKEKKSS